MKFQYILVSTIVILLFQSCSQTKENVKTDTNKLLVVATTGMIADLVENIAQEKANVQAIMGAGVDPHLYKATPNDLQMLRKANVIFYNGLHLEGKMADVLEKLGAQKKVFAVADGLDNTKLRKTMENTDAIDPHIWFDVSLWKNVAIFIGKKLGEADSPNAQFYQKNAQMYAASLDKLHEEIKSQIATIPKSGRVLITAHDAFGYFGDAYQIEVRGLQGISTVSEFGLKDVADLVNFIVQRKIKAVFVETSISQKSLEAVVRGCEQKGHTVKIGGTLYSDAMGDQNTPAGTYIGMVKANVNTITKALQ